MYMNITLAFKKKQEAFLVLAEAKHKHATIGNDIVSTYTISLITKKGVTSKIKVHNSPLNLSARTLCAQPRFCIFLPLKWETSWQPKVEKSPRTKGKKNLARKKDWEIN